MTHRTTRLSILFALAACASGPRAHISGGALGRVVIYRNGVAFYERNATVEDGALTLRVPRALVDDFLKSLTVVDRRAGTPLGVTIPRNQRSDDAGGYLEMRLEVPGTARADVMLTYVTAAPAWKPSYRVVVAPGGKVMLEAWAIVDNTTSEDWRSVLVGVGASSALAFRYDSWSVRTVERDLLRDEQRLAIAPPTAVSPIDDGGAAAGTEELATFDGDASGSGEVVQIQDLAPTIETRSTGSTITNETHHNVPAGRTFGSVLGSAAGAGPDPRAIANKISNTSKHVVIEVNGVVGATAAELDARALPIQQQLVDAGVDARRIHIVPKLSNSTTIRLLAVATPPPPAALDDSDTPVGESHFFSERPLTVRAGSSAMIPLHHGLTPGDVVYLYDPVGERGHDRFAFRSLRLENPTSDTLESGPVTVYGDGRFIGEGITDAIPPHAPVVIPFALDKQVVVTRSTTEADQIAKLVTFQRGVLTAEVSHRRETRFALSSRLPTPTVVYLRHRPTRGWQLVETPGQPLSIGDSQLYRVELAAGATRAVTLVESEPVQRTFELDSEATLGMIRVYLDAPTASPKLRQRIDSLLALHQQLAGLRDKVRTVTEQLTDYRTRADELNVQLVSLRAVRTGGTVIQSLKAKLAEISDRTQRATLELVELRDKTMVARAELSTEVAELRLD